MLDNYSQFPPPPLADAKEAVKRQVLAGLSDPISPEELDPLIDELFRASGLLNEAEDSLTCSLTGWSVFGFAKLVEDVAILVRRNAPTDSQPP